MIELRTEHTTYRLPTHASEITFSDYCDFRTHDRAFLNLEQPSRHRDAHLLAAAGVFVPEGLDKLPAYRSTDTATITEELSAESVYLHMVQVINAYTPTDTPLRATVTAKGEVFVSEWEDVQAAILNRPLTTGEVLTTLEYQRLAADRVVQNVANEGNIDFTLGTHELATLVRREGEVLPLDKRERERMIAQRAKMWGEVDLATVLDLRHFFLRACLQPKRTRALRTFGKVARVRTTPVRSRKHRRTAKR